MSSEAITDTSQQVKQWLDKEYLENALRKWLQDPKINVNEFAIRMATNKGDNFGSEMYRVAIRLEQREDPLTIIIKRILIMPQNPDMIAPTVFAREGSMLEKVLPEMQAVLKNAVPDVEPIGPHFINATDTEILMEDLQQGGFRMAQRQLGLDLNHCSLVLRTLAHYHAASVFLMERKDIDFSLFKKSLYSELKDLMGPFCNGMLRTLSEELKNMENLEKYSPKLASLAEKDFVSLLCNLIDDHEEDDFLVLSHGDLWVNNIMFRYSSTGELDGIRFVDFQVSSITSPCIDLQAFLIGSSNETVRTTYTDQLLEEYHETLCKTMAALECSTKPPTIEKLKEDFSKKSLYGMYAAFNGLPVLLSEPGQFDFLEVSQTGKPENALFRSKSYRKALEWYLPLYESKGVL